MPEHIIELSLVKIGLLSKALLHHVTLKIYKHVLIGVTDVLTHLALFLKVEAKSPQNYLKQFSHVQKLSKGFGTLYGIVWLKAL